MTAPTSLLSPLDSARKKAYWRLLPLLFVCYVIAYVDRSNVAIAKLTMSKDMPAFDNAVIGFGAGVFFWGYFLLEVPGTLIVERWSARKWICRIMVTWGIMAALTAIVKTPMQFYVVRFLLGLAEAGFFPGIIVYLTHWFPARDRTRALALFFVGTPVAQILSPKISNALLAVNWLGLRGWQWLYIFWGIPAVVLGIMVLVWLKDR
ncbi:MAG TPA: MFS transporter, partial [Opitutaceae bacterium]|nr:MFS transporter [Opitutaceae bacterium]